MATDIITQTLYFIGSYIGIILFIFFSLHWITKGWLTSFIKVKASRGKKILIHIISKTDTYYKIGAFKNKAFKYTLRDGTKQTLTEIERKNVFSSLGIYNLIIDEQTGTIYDYPEGTLNPGITPEGADDLIVRAQTGPQHNDKFKIVVISLLAVSLIAIFILAFMVVDVKQAILEIGKISGVI